MAAGTGHAAAGPHGQSADTEIFEVDEAGARDRALNAQIAAGRADRRHIADQHRDGARPGNRTVQCDGALSRKTGGVALHEGLYAGDLSQRDIAASRSQACPDSDVVRRCASRRSRQERRRSVGEHVALAAQNQPAVSCAESVRADDDTRCPTATDPPTPSTAPLALTPAFNASGPVALIRVTEPATVSGCAAVKGPIGRHVQTVRRYRRLPSLALSVVTVRPFAAMIEPPEASRPMVEPL